MPRGVSREPARIPVCEPWLAGNEERYVLDALRSGWISSAGRYLNEFEERFAGYCGVRHGVAASNGTAALHLALTALGVGPGDEVVIPDFSMAAVLFAVLYCGAKPVFVDAEPDTWNMSAELLAAKLTKRTKVIVAVHTYGHPCDMDPILAAARARGIRVLEDAAEAHGAEYKGRKCGALADIAAFSFYANKIVTTGEGGMVVTSDPALARRARYFRNLCFPVDGPRDYMHADLGFNYRLTNLQAAIGLAQVERLDESVARRRAHARHYNEALADVPAVVRPVERPWAKNVYWMYGIVLDARRARMTREEFAGRLASQGVETRPFFKPLRRQPPYERAFGRLRGSFPVSDRLGAEGLYLPSGTGLGKAELDRVCAAVRSVLGKS